MIQIFRARHRLASVLLLSVVIAGCAVVGAKAPSPELQQQIEAARSGPEHEAMATVYSREAASARASAAEHRKRAQNYSAYTGPRGGGGSMRAHCNEIAKNFDGIAAEYDGLAMDHRGLAAQAKP